MKTGCALIVIFLLLTGMTDAPAEDGAPERVKSDVTLNSEHEKISYAIGMQIGANLMQSELNLNPQVVVSAISDVLNGKEPALQEQEVREVMAAFQAKMQEEQAKQTKEMEERRKEEGAKNTARNAEFLSKNAAEQGVVTLPSGLQYKVIQAGDGPKPGPTDRVRVHYRGTLLDGAQFDSSYDRNEPAIFRVNQVIPGWQEALQLMTVGSKYQLFIPPAIAYGESGNQRIPPNALLLFDVELLEIVN